MDRRSFQNSSVNLNSQTKCIHTKNIFSMLDQNPAEENYKKIKKHVDNCKTCGTELKKFELETIEVKIHIPKPQIDNEIKEIYTREVSEIFKVFDLNEKAALRAKIKSKIKDIDSFGLSIIKTFASRKMIATYAFAGVMFVVLRHYFI
ncbi:MAG: hypothetical protein H7336_07480 [Bacteriovorax sp.]|nr:hypothetical protein [Bacteriovorax sp.]